MLRAVMIDDSAVKFLAGAAAFAPLEILHRIGAMRHGLKRRKSMHAGALQLADRLPVR